MSTSKRKTFVAREDLLNRLSTIASRKGFSLYDTVNDILEQAISIDESGLTLKNMVDECEQVESAKKAGFILCPERLWYDLTELSYKKSREASMETWYETGKWLGKQYVETIPKDPFSKFKKDLHAFVWNAADLTIKEDKKNLSISIVSPKFSEAYSRLLAFLLQGALEVFGYRPVNSEIGRGNIQITTVRAE